MSPWELGFCGWTLTLVRSCRPCGARDSRAGDKATDNGRTKEGTWEESVSRVWVGLQGG